MLQKLTPVQILVGLIVLALVLSVLGAIIKALAFLMWIAIGVAGIAVVYKYVMK